ncbi:tetratricopeptide repeat protein [Pedobacter africanus]|uniref:Tetratricopeptide repeat-containing protein n=1 Tax=Pedobacter africanus TaxID=151894 RepID=A0A1W2EB98_9SPHI|nr:tetratricopeptide repeat protein [Pedobacter africanus]SMD06348.1 Tetratricopeptide repeat-containing protein [Pedobacter africanus]
MRFLFAAILFLINLFSVAYALQKDLSGSSENEQLIRNNPNAAFVKIKRDLNKALQENNQNAAALCYQYLGKLFYYQAAYSQAVKYYYKANEIFKKSDDRPNLAKNLNMVGEAYYYGKQYGIALSKFQEALQVYTSLRNHGGMAACYGLIGQTQEKNGRYSSAMKYQRQALAEYRNSKDQRGIAKIYENMGSIYEDKLPMDSALKYYQLAFKLNEHNADDQAQIEILNNIGDVYRKTGRYAEALDYTKKAKAMSLKMNDQYQLSAAYRDLSKNFSLINRYDSAYQYSELGRNIFLKIFTEDNNKQLTLLQTLFELQQKDDAIQRFEIDKKTTHLIIIATVLIIILLILLAVSIISRQRLKLRNEQELNAQNQSLYEVQKNAIKAELELKSKELTSNTLHVIQSNQFLDELKAEILNMIKDDKRDQKKRLQQIIQKINQSINHDRHWKEFSGMFEQIHQAFFDKLKNYAVDLTANDLRLVALIKMNLSSKDMAIIFGISQDSLRVARYRLRKKLDIPQGENLSSFIQAL